MRAERRNAILKARFDARSQARQPLMLDTRANRAAKLRHEKLLAELEETRARLLLLEGKVRKAA